MPITGPKDTSSSNQHKIQYSDTYSLLFFRTSAEYLPYVFKFVFLCDINLSSAWFQLFLVDSAENFKVCREEQSEIGVFQTVVSENQMHIFMQR